jgi:hypothetical protein
VNWLNIHTDTLRSEEYLGAEPLERATWLNLMAWCVSQENGGVIEGAASWGERKWMQVCGITKQEATLVSKLYRLNTNGGLVVTFYPSDKEDEVKVKREVARENGKKGGRPPKPPEEKPTPVILETDDKPTSESGREGKGREWKPECPIPPVASDETRSFLDSLWKLSPRTSRPRTSRKDVTAAWKSIPAKDRPTHDEALAAYLAWTKCEAWTKENGQYVCGLHLWIRKRQWENVPEGATPGATPGAGCRKLSNEKGF